MNEAINWLYEEDNFTLMCKCPACEKRMIIHAYQYHNPYNYCPYCGRRLFEGDITKARKRVYKDEA